MTTAVSTATANRAVGVPSKIQSVKILRPSQQCLYFDVVLGLVWSNDPKNYAGGSVAQSRGSHAGQVKGDNPHDKRHPDPLGCGLGVRVAASPRVNIHVDKNSEIYSRRMINRRRSGYKENVW